ncbi:cytochrome P450 [Lutibaculum baratangense]|uniref:Cytochrome P450 n=1 Tax=Lutibaculum baratangense AMV1 TaxID=631454 RepID=V4R123_9HYPH|nr:cytochrome P450 [Lutibaculum baratangense]ESR25697.1 cytochrome P450 [Lutibaculum baratangense AMV1]
MMRPPAQTDVHENGRAELAEFAASPGTCPFAGRDGGSERHEHAAFRPPLPLALDRHPSTIQRLRMRLRSSLDLFLHGSYGFVGVSRHRIPSVRSLKKRFMFTVRDPAVIREILVRRPKDFPKGELMHKMLGKLTGYSIFVSNGAAWERQRRIVDQAFTHAGVRDVFPLMRDASDACLARLKAQAAGGGPVSIDAEMTHYAGDVIFRTIYSEPMGGEAAGRIFSAFEVFQRLAFAQGVLALGGIPFWLMWTNPRSWRMAREIRDVLNGPLERRLTAVRAGEPVSSRDILSTLMTAVDPVTGTCFEGDELLDEIAVLFLAGHETSAAALGWALYCIANRPDIQQAMREEVRTVLGDGEPRFGDMKRLELTRNVFREALRLYPPVAYFSRDTTRDEQLAGVEIAAGSPLTVPVWLMHRHTEFWRDPNGFDPHRFASEETREAQRLTYMPFSMGARVCVGAAFAMQEATLVLAELVRAFEIRPVVGHVPQPVSRLTVRSENGIRLHLTPIEANSEPLASGAT